MLSQTDEDDYMGLEIKPLTYNSSNKGKQGKYLQYHERLKWKEDTYMGQKSDLNI